MSQSIDSSLQENRVFLPATSFSQSARIQASDLDALYRHAERDYEGFWESKAREYIDWHTPFTRTLDKSKAPHFSWFVDGKLNVSYNCLDRNLTTHGDKTAIQFEGEDGDSRAVTYRELHLQVCLLANALKSLGIGKGDRVVIYMPMIPEAVIAMQACARIGAIHSVVFGGFSSESLRDRINDAGARLIITADGGHRGGKIIELKDTVNAALDGGCPSLEKTIVFARTRHEVNMQEGRDIWWHDAIAEQATECEPEWVEAEHPLFLLYTSGSTGKPKGIQHSTAGYLLMAILTNLWIFDMSESDVFWCTADVGWVTGHTYVAYGPLAVGATQIMFEGAPTYPDGGRFWALCEKYRVSIFYTAPTAIRALMRLGDELPARHDLSSLRLLGTVGEPINPEAWMWYHKIIGKERCPIVDTWWQTETGAHMIAPFPGVTPLIPGSCTRPLPGINADIVDEDGHVISEANKGGYLVVKKPWPSMLRTIWGDDQRYRKTYWEKFKGRYYVAGDSARKDEDGNFWIMGRIDDVLNVSGHRLGTMEIESALVGHSQVTEAAVVGRPDDLKGQAIVAFVTIKGACPTGEDAKAQAQELRSWVAKEIGPIAKPDDIRFAEGLPKTRSGKIMRRILRNIASGEAISEDISTLENEHVVEQLKAAY